MRPTFESHAEAVAHVRRFRQRIRSRLTGEPYYFSEEEKRLAVRASRSSSELMTADEKLELREKTRGETIFGRRTPRERL